MPGLTYSGPITFDNYKQIAKNFRDSVRDGRFFPKTEIYYCEDSTVELNFMDGKFKVRRGYPTHDKIVCTYPFEDYENFYKCIGHTINSIKYEKDNSHVLVDDDPYPLALSSPSGGNKKRSRKSKKKQRRTRKRK
jgi:hypothetical protein